MILQTLTPSEEDIMQLIWNKEKIYFRELMDIFPEPKPHQNTVATLLKILVEKEFVGITVMNRHHEYYPAVSKEEYSKRSMAQLTKNYFEGSFSNVVSFLVKENDISVEELEKLLQQIKKQQNAKK